jgi:hypothetical protein
MNYYTPGHKYFRKVLFQFEQLFATTDFNNTDQRQRIHEELDELTFYLRETAKFEIENCHPLLNENEPFIIAQIEAGYKVAESKENLIRNILGARLGHEKRSRFSEEDEFNIYLACVEFVDTYRQLFTFKEKNLVPVLSKHNADKSLRALALQSRNQMSLDQMKENIVEKIMPCLNFLDKIEVIKDIKAGASEEVFNEVWKIVSDQFKPHQRTLILQKLAITTS